MEGIVPFSTALGLILLLELGDKTQLTTISLASRNPGAPVFVGAAAGLVAVTAIGAAAGAALAGALPDSLIAVKVGGGLLFIALGVVGYLRRDRERLPEEAARGRAVVKAFTVNFVAEFGDKTQIAVVVLAATTAAPWSVFAGASVALTAVAAASVLLGAALARALRAEALRLVAASLFIVAGALLIVEALAS